MTRSLVLGGSAWLGREIASQLVARGDEVTCVARGESGPVAEGVHFVRVDRRDPSALEHLEELEGEQWDDVIELSYDLDLVTNALRAFAHCARHWTLISSVSVYASNSDVGADETAELVSPTDLSDYAHAKVAAERATSAYFAKSAADDRLLVVRPGLIAGPGDPSDRFGYWMSRAALAGSESVLVPEVRDRSVQFIDVRDLAHWVVDAGGRGVVGTVNAVGRPVSFVQLLEVVSAEAGFAGEFVSADDAWLVGRGVNYWAGARSLPLWLPRTDEGFARRASDRFVRSGGVTRALDVSVRDVLLDEQRRGLHRARRSGLARRDEVLLLDELR